MVFNRFESGSEKSQREGFFLLNGDQLIWLMMRLLDEFNGMKRIINKGSGEIQKMIHSLSSYARNHDYSPCGSSPLTQTGMVDFMSGRAVIDATHHKWVKYEAKCANIGYGFLPFSFSSLGELEKDLVALLKRIRKFSVTHDIGARAAIHIFNRISFAIAKGVGARLVSRLPTNFL
nr:hypothetical protein [Tanacetum cinerariifolium]